MASLRRWLRANLPEDARREQVRVLRPDDVEPGAEAGVEEQFGRVRRQAAYLPVTASGRRAWGHARPPRLGTRAGADGAPDKNPFSGTSIHPREAHVGEPYDLAPRQVRVIQYIAATVRRLTETSAAVLAKLSPDPAELFLKPQTVLTAPGVADLLDFRAGDGRRHRLAHPAARGRAHRRPRRVARSALV